jgi:hypothetical protein
VKGLHGRRQLVLRFDLADAARCRECGDDGGLELEGVRGGTKLHGLLSTSRRRAISLRATEEPDQAICKFTQEDGLGCLYVERVEGGTDEKILEL